MAIYRDILLVYLFILTIQNTRLLPLKHFKLSRTPSSMCDIMKPANFSIMNKNNKSKKSANTHDNHLDDNKDSRLLLIVRSKS